MTLYHFKYTIFLKTHVPSPGNSYEKDFILEYLETYGVSPVTKKPLSANKLSPNKALKAMIDQELNGDNKKSDNNSNSIFGTWRLMGNIITPDKPKEDLNDNKSTVSSNSSNSILKNSYKSMKRSLGIKSKKLATNKQVF